MTKSLIPLLILVAVLTPLAAQAQPSESMNVSYYGVKGVTVNELIRNLNRHRGAGSWAYTTWRVTRPGCSTTLVIRQTLPRWLDRARATARVQKKWDRFYAALLAHEAEHVQIARNAAAAADALSCSAEYAQVVRKWMATERTLDQRTRHGIRSGATLRYE
jgi:predicted secreted Zn-dependent protease